MYNQLRGCVKINAQGKRLYGFINRLHRGGICCFGQYVKNDVFYGEIYRHDLKRVQALASELGIELSFYEHETLSKKLLRYRKRIGLTVGAVLAAGLLIYFSNVIVTIEVKGNSAVSDEVILSALEELGVKEGSLIRGRDFITCENRLMIMVEGISWAGIQQSGNRLVVEVTETEAKPEMVMERVPCNVISDKAAQIISTSVYDGQLMRIVGDYVMPGDMLISGVVEDSKGHVTKHHAMGKIVGIYEETAVFTQEYSAEQYLPTGRTEKENYLKLFNLKIPLFFGKTDFERYTCDEQTKPLVLFGRELPIGCIGKTLTETSLTVNERTDEELHELLTDKVYLYEQNFLSDVKILEREIETEKKESSLTYTVRYTIEGEIGIQREIFIK